MVVERVAVRGYLFLTGQLKCVTRGALFSSPPPPKNGVEPLPAILEIAILPLNYFGHCDPGLGVGPRQDRQHF